jgi:O-antigen/teichoic acid export membrane protein
MPRFLPKWYLTSVTCDLAGSLLVQFTPLAATLLVAGFSSLADAAKYTLALSIAAPLYLMSTMATSELIVARAPGFQDYLVISIAKAIVLSICFGICVLLAVLFWPEKTTDSSFMTIFGLVCLARLSDGFFDTAIQFFRRDTEFRKLFYFSSIYGLLFVVLATLSLLLPWSRVEYGVPLAVCGASFAAAGCSVVWLRRAEPVDFKSAPINALHFARIHYVRGIAHFTNSLQTTFPRYLLEWFALPQQQAAYTILGMICRAFILPLQSLFVPVIPAFARRFTENAPRTLILAFSIVACLAAVVSGGLSLLWWLATEWDLVRLLNQDLPNYLSLEDGILVLCASGLYLLRFSIWQVTAMFVVGERQLAYSVAGVVATLAAGVLLIPSSSIAGAAIADAIGSLFLLALPLAYLSRRTPHAWVAGAHGNSSRTSRLS